ncbi:MAG: single-stranded-DNA-specific exonuclease RecJ [Candidatus Hydrogenedens sp.]
MNDILQNTVWKINTWNREKVDFLSNSLEIPPIIAHLLINRGIDTRDKVEDFFRPSIKQIVSPFSLRGMDSAVERIMEAKNKGEKIWVFGDYDVDGIAGTALLTRGLKRFGIQNVYPLLPERLSDGYGLTPEIVEKAYSESVRLIITVDNGISTIPASLRAMELGIDLIITDHHIPCEELPVAKSIINPRLEESTHPSANLCGAGVAFKLALALNGSPNDLDLVALATIADVMPLTGENRTLVSLGLKHLSKYKRIGLRALAEMSNISLDDMDVEKISYGLAPRINAAGRLDNAFKSLELLLCENDDRVLELSQELIKANEERKNIENEILNDAISEIESYIEKDAPVIVLTRRNWHQGIIGLVASRLAHRYSVPVALITVDEKGIAKGSIRSVYGIDIIQILNQCKHILEQYGGHRLAAGFTLYEENIPHFRELIKDLLTQEKSKEKKTVTLDIDCVVNFSQIDSSLLQWLQRFEPTGYGNPPPLFCTTNVEIIPHTVQIFKDLNVRMAMKQDSRLFYGMGYYLAERFFKETNTKKVDVVYTPKISTSKIYGGCKLQIKDFKPSN